MFETAIITYLPAHYTDLSIDPTVSASKNFNKYIGEMSSRKKVIPQNSFIGLNDSFIKNLKRQNKLQYFLKIYIIKYNI